MPGGVFAIIGIVALLIAACELLARLFPRRLVDEMQDICSDIPSPRQEPEVARLRDKGAL